MKLLKNNLPLCFLFSVLMFTAACKKKESVATPAAAAATPAKVTTNDVSSFTDSTAECSGNVTSQGSSTVTSRGICWDNNPNPTVKTFSISEQGSVGAFYIQLGGLSSGTKYYFKAYCETTDGIVYGAEKNFTTK